MEEGIDAYIKLVGIKLKRKINQMWVNQWMRMRVTEE